MMQAYMYIIGDFAFYSIVDVTYKCLNTKQKMLQLLNEGFMFQTVIRICKVRGEPV